MFTVEGHVYNYFYAPKGVKGSMNCEVVHRKDGYKTREEAEEYRDSIYLDFDEVFVVPTDEASEIGDTW